MTDQTIPAGLTRGEAQAVREWAEQALATEVQDATVVDVARVLLAVLPTPPTTAKENPELPDQTLDDQVRPIVAAMRAAMRRDEHAYPEAKFLADLSGYIKDLEALLPTPPTLADMTPKERSACQWMQADTERWGRVVITVPSDLRATRAALLDRGGSPFYADHADVTPRPDLPRMTWPGDQAAPAPSPALPDGWRLADHPGHGRVVVTSATPDADGHVYGLFASDIDRTGFDWHPYDPEALTYIDQEAGDVTPAPKAGDVIESADDPRLDTLPVGSVLADCDGDEVEKTGRGWKGDGYIPRPIEGDKFGPWTVCRIGKEGDQ